ncbi:MAG: hypothetical protein KF774_16185 [Planctomyces sp.]|nr:hypothetical protein [Planctomyces sp.]
MTEGPDAPRQLHEALRQLRRQVRRYVLLEGLAIVIVVLGLGFWISYGLDELYFQYRRLELPRWLRLGFTTLLIAAGAMAFLIWVVGRLWHRFGRRLLALVVERRFPQLGDRLISAIELENSPQTTATPLARVMWERTAREAATTLQRLDLKQVFDPRPLQRSLAVAGVMLASLAGLGVANAAGVERWVQAFLLGRDDYWEPFRKSAMTVRVIAEPGGRIREFDGRGVYLHPRGSDLTIEAESAEGRPAPDRASLSFRSFGAGGAARGATPMSRRGERVFRQTLTRVIDEHHLWVTAGDFVNREPLRVLIVDPPRVDRLQLLCDYPSYTGLDSIEDRPVVVQSLQVSIPMETKFLLEGRANKPLSSVLIRSEMFELRFSAPDSRSGSQGSAGEPPALILRESPTAAPRAVRLAAGESWFADDRMSFRVPFRIAAAGTEQLLALADGAEPPLPLPPVAPLSIQLEDADGIVSSDPAMATLSGIPDLAPVVDVRLTGVSNVVTRLAEIPIRGRITDDYGVARAEFGFEVLPDNTAAASNSPPEPVEQRTRPLGLAPQGQKDFALGGQSGLERFALRPLELSDGQRLQLSVYAEDGDTINGPNRSRGEMFTLRIVPAEELLARLYEKEINLRQRFEQIMEETRRLRQDLAEHRGRTDEWNQLRQSEPEGEPTRQAFNSIDACARRSLHQIRTNHTEARAIEAAFGEIRAEMVNNRVDTPTLLERIDIGIVAPLKTINESDYPGIDSVLGLFVLTMERRDDPARQIDDALESVDRLLARMEQVLSEMRSRGNINEMIQQLQTIIEQQQRLRDATEQRKLDELFEGLGIP